MARRTVEDCTQRVPNHFELVLLAAGRAKSLDAGADPMVPREGDKNPVVALREIGQDAVDLKLLHDGVVTPLAILVEECAQQAIGTVAVDKNM